MLSRSISERTQPTEPSPLQIRIRKGSKWRNNRRPNWGPAEIKSNTCAGFSNCLKRRKNLTPWLSPDLELTKTSSGENEPCGFTTSQASSIPIEWREVGGTTETLLGPSGHFTSTLGRHCVWIVARHHKHRQSCNRSTEPQVLSQSKHLADTGRFPSIHWCGIIRLPSGSSMISFPILANVLHLQLLMAFAAHRLWTLNLHTSHERPCEVTPVNASRHTLEIKQNGQSITTNPDFHLLIKAYVAISRTSVRCCIPMMVAGEKVVLIWRRWIKKLTDRSSLHRLTPVLHLFSILGAKHQRTCRCD